MTLKIINIKLKTKKRTYKMKLFAVAVLLTSASAVMIEADQESEFNWRGAVKKVRSRFNIEQSVDE